MERREVRVPDGRGGTVSGVLLAPDRPSAGPGVVLGHGAGGNLHTPLLNGVAAAVATAGYPCLRYNFPYADAGRRRPDFPRVLEACVRGAAGWLSGHGASRLILAGKSLGGRMASHVVADGTVEASALVFLGYPLHPVGRPDTLRDAHLPRIGCPMLFIHGTRDRFATSGLLHATLERLPTAVLHEIEGADHDFRVPAAQRRPYHDVLDGIGRFVTDWISQVCR